LCCGTGCRKCRGQGLDEIVVMSLGTAMVGPAQEPLSGPGVGKTVIVTADVNEELREF
jgi:hypothetical protein